MPELTNIDNLWDHNDPAGTREKFEAEMAKAGQHTDRDWRLQLMTQIARTYSKQRSFDQAHAVLDGVEKESPLSALTEIRYLLERGRTYNSAKMQDKAIPLFFSAWEKAREAKAEFYAVDAAHMLGIASPPHEQIAWNEKAIAYAEQAEDERARNWLGSLYNNLGWTYHDAGDYEKALDLFERALIFRRKHGSKRAEEIAKWCVARVLRSLDRIDDALVLLRELEAEAVGDGFTEEEIGTCLLIKGQLPDAQPYFAAAYEKLSQIDWLAADEPDRIARLKELAGIE